MQAWVLPPPLGSRELISPHPPGSCLTTEPRHPRCWPLPALNVNLCASARLRRKPVGAPQGLRAPEGGTHGFQRKTVLGSSCPPDLQPQRRPRRGPKPSTQWAVSPGEGGGQEGCRRRKGRPAHSPTSRATGTLSHTNVAHSRALDLSPLPRRNRARPRNQRVGASSQPRSTPAPCAPDTSMVRSRPAGSSPQGPAPAPSPHLRPGVREAPPGPGQGARGAQRVASGRPRPPHTLT